MDRLEEVGGGWWNMEVGGGSNCDRDVAVDVPA